MKQPQCKHCQSTLHYSFQCYSQRKPIKGKKRIRKIGKVGRQWWQTRQDWIKKNLPDSGYWNCCYCGKQLRINELTLDHVVPRSRAPHLRFEDDNLVPACWSCNMNKGSRTIDKL